MSEPGFGTGNNEQGTRNNELGCMGKSTIKAVHHFLRMKVSRLNIKESKLLIEFSLSCFYIFNFPFPQLNIEH